ncbi:MAG: protein-glutamine glutaminase family protein [Alphaproteobacteria bacterium]
MTLNAARQLFERLAQDKRIPWNNLDSSCIARADAAVGIAILEQGIDPSELGRVFLQSPGQVAFMAGYRNTQGTLPRRGMTQDDADPRSWDTHTALCAHVKMADESVATFVIDPSLSDRPVTPREWAGLQTPDSVVLEADIGAEPRLLIDSDHPAIQAIKRNAVQMAAWKKANRAIHDLGGEVPDYSHLDIVARRERLAGTLATLAETPAAERSPEARELPPRS